MKHLNIFDDKQQLAQAAAESAIHTLQTAISTYGSATWVLAGGTTPETAYEIIANKYLNAIDWSKVTISIGDERIAPLDSPDSNWHQAEQALLQYIPQAKQLRPASDQPVAVAAADYNQRLESLARLDLVWLGMGEDGHTLSLFPGQTAAESPSLVVAVTDSPKPPKERISLNFTALKLTKHAAVLVAGTGKAKTLAAVASGNQLPVRQAAEVIEQAGGTVDWLCDAAAATNLELG